jgi:hypothetical protein
MELKTLRQIIVQNVQHEPHIVQPEAIKYFLSGEWHAPCPYYQVLPVWTMSRPLHIN